MKIRAMPRLIFQRTGHLRRYHRARDAANKPPSDTNLSQNRPVSVGISISWPSPASDPLLFPPCLAVTRG